MKKTFEIKYHVYVCGTPEWSDERAFVDADDSIEACQIVHENLHSEGRVFDVLSFEEVVEHDRPEA